MSAARFDDDLQPLQPGQRVKDAVGLRRQNALAELLRETAMGAHIKGGPGLRVKRGAQGVTITQRKPPPPRGAARGPNMPYKLRNGTDPDTGVFSITSGLFNALPLRKDAKDGTVITNLTPPEWTLGDGMMWLGIKYDLTFESGYLVAAVLSGDGAYVFMQDAEDDEPLPDVATGQFYVPLAGIVAGVIVDNYGGGNWWGLLRDDSSTGVEASALAIGRS